MFTQVHSVIEVTRFHVQARGRVVVSQETGPNNPVISHNLITARMCLTLPRPPISTHTPIGGPREEVDVLSAEV